MTSFRFKQESCYTVAMVTVMITLIAVGAGIGILVALNV